MHKPHTMLILSQYLLMMIMMMMMIFPSDFHNPGEVSCWLLGITEFNLQF